MYQGILNKLRPKMQEVLEKFEDSLKGLRVSQANAALVENISVSYYGSNTPLKQMANISIPDPNLIVVQPWDNNSLNDIVLAIENSKVGLNPSSDGRTIRLVLPPMTAERREDLVKMIHTSSEQSRIVLRNLREDTWKSIKQLKTRKEITEDDCYKAEKDLNKMIDDFNLKINQLITNKEKEIRAI